jgi:uncharacterized protein (UPF0333 family)
MLKKVFNKKGQISIDAVLAVLFILLVSTVIYYDILNNTEQFKDAELADRLYSIADSFENYALISYSKKVHITVTLKPVGVKNYTIYYGNKSIVVNTTRKIRFVPAGNFVNVSSLNGGENDGTGLELNKTIKIIYGSDEFYIVKNVSAPIK